MNITKVMEALLSASRSPVRRGRTIRPRRGTPADTRERLVAAAAAVFNRDGYHGTDSNRLARAAGYAPATFYKHFADKRALLLAAYERWVTSEWQAIGAALGAPASPADRAERIVALTLAHHRRWTGLRASLRALVATDPVVRRFHRAQRRRQLELLAGMRRRDDPRSARAARVDDAVMLFTLERTLDAVAEGEAAALGLDRRVVIARLRAIVQAALAPAPARGVSARGDGR